MNSTMGTKSSETDPRRDHDLLSLNLPAEGVLPVLLDPDPDQDRIQTPRMKALTALVNELQLHLLEGQDANELNLRRLRDREAEQAGIETSYPTLQPSMADRVLLTHHHHIGSNTALTAILTVLMAILALVVHLAVLPQSIRALMRDPPLRCPTDDQVALGRFHPATLKAELQLPPWVVALLNLAMDPSQ